ncbi:hypothetical protein CLV01_3530 [Delftia sp. 60]|uniref:hypothetical protein n=1 Tax=Delftia sp. 60 TaxID=2035216 RepID=UPI000C5D4C43|nr:hypothetical protein [Delftia sp. 60]PIF37696.1 hypothetical protein CLU98_2919 [Burkholderiales bacterium 23]PIF67123.1 hypothetical protein CLV01_3530 [Delftia sp. 60]
MMMKLIFIFIGSMIPCITFAGENTLPPIQDLQEIKRSADEFLKEENKRQKTEFTTVRVNPKIIVEQCATSLKSDWAPLDGGLARKSVQVVCKSTSHNKKGWHVLVPVAGPITPKN